ncbi:MAG TPA: hypothetical protein VLJ79_15315 [Candidatus Binatia bacterium]|nr:hypothetical protein [Candidatus Binatia bacterium]
MDTEQQKVYDATVATTGRVGRGPSVGYAYSPGLWQVHNASSAHLLNCSLTPAQVRIVSLMTARHWSPAYPWSAQAVVVDIFNYLFGSIRVRFSLNSPSAWRWPLS